MGDGPDASPRRAVGDVEGGRTFTTVLDVSERQNRREALAQKQVRGVLLVAIRRRTHAAVEELELRIAGDVTGSRDDGIGVALCREAAKDPSIVRRLGLRASRC